MPRVVRVSFRQAGRLYQFDAGDLDLAPGDRVVAETSRGRELGTVRTEPVEIPPDEAATGLKRITRKARGSEAQGTRSSNLVPRPSRRASRRDIRGSRGRRKQPQMNADGLRHQA